MPMPKYLNQMGLSFFISEYDYFAQKPNRADAIANVEAKQKELESVYGPVISRIYAAANPQQGTTGENPFNNFNFDAGANPFAGK